MKNKDLDKDQKLAIAHKILAKYKYKIKELQMELGELGTTKKKLEIENQSLRTEIKSLRDKIHKLEQGHQISTPKCDYFGKNSAYEITRLTTENQILRKQIEELEIIRGHKQK